MVRELTDKVKEEIVEAQIDFIKRQDEAKLIDYTSLSNHLMEAINEYEISSDELNRDIDYPMMQKMEKATNGKVVRRLINSTRDFYKIDYNSPVKNRDLLKLHEIALQNMNKRHPYLKIPNYGPGTHELLTNYLKEKNLIKGD